MALNGQLFHSWTDPFHEGQKFDISHIYLTCSAVFYKRQLMCIINKIPKSSPGNHKMNKNKGNFSCDSIVFQELKKLMI